ncbi:MAG: WYL domain-containing protein [Cloacibacterium sp.]|nr:WYL domain-containing protein [Cloacibacterium sp.]
MKKDFFLARYALIIKRLEKSPATFQEIESYLLNSFEFQDAKITSYSIRTLQRDLKDISNLFNMEIHNRKKGDNRYYISSRPILEVDEYNQRLLESYQIINAANTYPDFAEYVFLESRKPRGIDNFYDLLFAIRNKKITIFEHFSFASKATSSRKVHPLALKESHDRWYLIAVDTKDGKLKSFGLDRIRLVEITKAGFRGKYKIDLKEHFKNAFGVINLAEQKPQKIVLECTKDQAEYIKSFPLHASQDITEESEDKTIFQLCLYPTYDFMQEILSFGKEVKVLEPQCLINDIKHHLQESIKHYF